MYKIGARVTFDKVKAAALIRAKGDDALTVMSNQVLQDVGQYVPKDQGTLENSALSHSDRKAEDGKYTLRWDTPYAQYLWHGDVMKGNPASRTYGPEKLTFTSALAREEWAKYARKVHGDDWKNVYQAAFRKGLQK